MAEGANPFGIKLEGGGDNTPVQPWDLGSGPKEPGKIARGFGAVKHAASNLKHSVQAPHLPHPSLPYPHAPHIPRPDVGKVAGGAGERLGHMTEVFRDHHVREAISHAVEGVTGRIPKPDFVATVAKRSVSALADRQFMGQSLLDFASGAIVSGGAKTAARMALGISGVGTVQMAILGMAGGAASAGFREYMHQRRDYTWSDYDVDTGISRAELKDKLKIQSGRKIVAAMVRGGVFGAVGGVVGGEIAGAILDKVSMPNIQMPNVQGPDLSGIPAGMSNLAGGAKDTAGGVLSNAGQAIGGAGGAAGEVTKNVPVLGGAQEAIGNAFGGTREAVGNLGQVPGGIGGGVGSGLGKTGEFFGGIGGGIGGAVGSAAGGAGEAVGGALGAAGEAAGGVGGTVGEASRNLPGVGGALGGAEDFFGNVGKTVGGAFETAGNFVQENNPLVAHPAPDSSGVPNWDSYHFGGHEVTDTGPVDSSAAHAVPAGPDGTTSPVEAAPPTPELPKPLPPTDINGHTVAGSVMDNNLTWDGQHWALLENGTKNIGHVFEAVGQQAVPLDQGLLAQNLQAAAVLQAHGQLTYAAHPDLFNLFHLSNGTASVYNELLNEDTLDSLKNLGIVAK